MEGQTLPRPRIRNGCGLTRTRFGLIPVRSPLLRKSLRFPFLQVLRCFSSLRWPLCPMYSGISDRASPLPGFPIRKSSDHSLLSSSPRLIAANRALHRLLAPRHPPCTLHNLTTHSLQISKKMGWSEQFKRSLEKRRWFLYKRTALALLASIKLSKIAPH